MKIAIIGGGAAGLTTAYLLDKVHAVTVFEKRPILGGNVRTLGKNVAIDTLPAGVIIDNGVIEFQRDHFVNFHKLLDQLGVPTEKVIGGGSSSLYLANGQHILGPGVVIASKQKLLARARAYGKLLRVWPAYRRIQKQAAAPISSLRDKPTSDFLNDHDDWHVWQKMLLMYGYSIPYQQIGDFPAEIALPLLGQSKMGTVWTRIVGGVYTYMEKILAALSGEVHVDVSIRSIQRNDAGVEITFASGEQQQFDKVLFATPPDQVLALLSDPSEQERQHFAAWRPNHATTVIHTDTSMYQPYGVTTYSEFDVFQKDKLGDAGYNAYLNRLCGLPETAPHYNLAYNLMDRIEPEQIIQTQNHHTPLYTTEALHHRTAVIATNGTNHTYHAGAWLDNGLHEGAINSALAVKRLFGC